MPNPGSSRYDRDKAKLRREMEREGVRDDKAEHVADEAMTDRGEGRANARKSGSGDRHGDPWPKRPPPSSTT